MNIRRSESETEETQEMPAPMLAELKKLSSIPPPERREPALSDNREPEPPEAA